MAAVRGLNEKAKAFVLRHSEQAPSAFILNTNEFTKLQRYLYASKALPLSGSAFEDLFPDHCFKADVQLYHRMRETLLRISNRCDSFRVEPMVIIGGLIANFAKDTALLTERLLSFLQILGDENVSRQSDKYRSTNRMAYKVLDTLMEHAHVVDTRCESILYPLEKFRGETSLDKYELEHIVKRLGGVLPPKEERESKIDEVMEEAKTLVSTNGNALDEEIAKACEEGKIKWYHKLTTYLGLEYFPVVGTVLLVVDMARHNGLFKALRMLNDRYEEEKRKGNFFKETTVLALANQISMLSDEQKTIESTMSNVISAVKKMQETFYELKISFENIKRNLDSVVDTEMNEEDVHEKICAIDDLAEAMETWKDVSVLATVFQRTGLVMHVSEAPREITGEWL
ncbi:hypothetical protein F5Y08DRAFT_341782 [Xylaria arbuscula]|nr:hypothetical protein F5Y08DRAFT_341782 [Xylaria arbuscula]